MEQSKRVRIFLSYSRNDDEPFVARLHAALAAAGFSVWFDRVSMPSRSLTFHQEIRDAVNACDRLVLIVGPNAVSSDYVTQEWRFAYFEAVKCVNPIVRTDAADAAGKKIDAYSLIPEDLRLVHAEDFRDDAQFDAHVANLIRQLNDPLPPAGKLVAVPELPPHYLDQPARIAALRDILLADLQKPVVVSGAAARVGLQGMGGIGKSVLASALAHRPEVRRAFPDGVYWVTLGQEPNVADLQRGLARALGDNGLFTGVDAGKEKLRELLGGRAALLVLDDVWQRRDAEAFNVLGPRGRLLLTTRDAGLVTALAAKENHYQVQLPAEAEAEALLAKAAGVPIPELTAEARDIVDECGRLPLGLALCGGMVQGGRAWQDVLDALREHDLEYLSDSHPAEEQHRSIWKAMDVSIRALAEDERERFAELAVFALDTGAPEAAVETLWAHTAGLSPRRARDLLMNFRQRSLIDFDQSTRRMTIHDLLHNFAEGMAGRGFGSLAALHGRLLAAYRKACAGGWASGPDDGYFLQHLRYHLLEAGMADELVSLLLDLRWLEAKVRAQLAFDILLDFAESRRAVSASDTRRGLLSLVEEALRRDIRFIARHSFDGPHLLFQCLWNSCWWYDCPESESYYSALKGGAGTEWPMGRPGPRLSELMCRWREEKERRSEFTWLQSLRPPPVQLGTGQEDVNLGHRGAAPSVGFSSNGRYVAAGSGDDTLKLWDLADDSSVILGAHEGRVRSVAFSPDSSVVASASGDLTIRVWNVVARSEILRLTDQDEGAGAIAFVAFSPDGRMLVSAAEGHSVRVFHDAHTSSFVREGYGVKLWDSVSGTLLHRLPGRAAVFLRDGHHLVTGYDHSVWICDAQSGVARLVYERGPGGFVRTLAAGSGDAVAVGFTDGCLRVLHAQTGDVLAEAISKLGRPGDVTAAAFSLDGTLLVSAHSEGFPEATTIRIWNPVNMQMVSSIDCPVASIWGLAPSPDGKRIAAASDDGFVRFWRIGSPVSGRQLRGFPLMGGADKLLFSHDGNRLAILDAYGNIRVFNGRTGEFLWSEHAAHRDGAYTIWFASSGELVCDSGSPGSERVWSMETGADLDRVQTTSGGGLQQQFQFRGPANRETKYRYVASAGEGRIENTIGGEAVAWYPVPFSEFDASPTGLEWAGISGNQLHVVRLNGPDV